MRKEYPPEQLQHIPVLLEATLQKLNPQKGETYLDLTAGYGGHAGEFIERIGEASLATLVDRDDMAIESLKTKSWQEVRLLHMDFLTAAQQLIAEGQQFDMVLVDLGVSSPQLDIAERGFSFARSGPLDMRMDRRTTLTAETIVNSYSQAEIADIIRTFGEEPARQAKMIAEAIVASRPHNSTGELASVIAKNIRRPRGRTHPATRTFQALRMALNQELDQIRHLLPLLPKLLNGGGRVGIISFHSLEDRLVKRYFSEQKASGYEAELEILTKKPISGATQDVHNPRARSAKLRAAVKIKT